MSQSVSFKVCRFGHGTPAHNTQTEPSATSWFRLVLETAMCSLFQVAVPRMRHLAVKLTRQESKPRGAASRTCARSVHARRAPGTLRARAGKSTQEPWQSTTKGAGTDSQRSKRISCRNAQSPCFQPHSYKQLQTVFPIVWLFVSSRFLMKECLVLSGSVWFNMLIHRLFLYL